MGSSIPPEDPGAGVASAEPPPAGEPGDPAPGLLVPGEGPPRRRRGRRRKVLIWTAGITAGVVALAAAGVFLVYRHLNGNIQQRDVSGLLGSQPVDLHPQAENILIIGSDSRFGLSGSYGKGLVTDQSDTTMVMHIAANRQWAEVMSIPRDSYVSIPACKMGNGQMSAAQTFKINEAFALGNLDGNNTALGVACTLKTVEQDTGIYIDHFVVVNFTGFQNMVSALGGVQECNTQPINDPLSGLKLTAGQHLLTPKQALAYVRARYTLGDGSDLDRIARQQAFMSSLVQRVQSKLLNPVAIYRFLDAATKSLTIDTKLGGATGLYNLASSLRNLPSNKVAFFTLPTYPRSEVVPTDTANVLWNQPQDSQIFHSFRNDVPASKSLFTTGASASASATPSASTPVSSPATAVTPSPAVSASGDQGSSGTASSGPAAGSATASPQPTVTPPLPIPSARTANQNICTG
ncbi:MAG TPA: LCP family protein [Streptosporangiaceae bacterium]|jgi:LCP family protein required for cell wall assembly